MNSLSSSAKSAQRLLGALQTTINHDLPNMLVAQQGLLQMMDLEERERLSPAGQDYLRRLGGIAQRLQAVIATLRAINKAGATPKRAEPVELKELMREVVAAARPHAPQVHLICHCRMQTPVLEVPRVALQQTLLEITKVLAGTAPPGTLHFHVNTRVLAGGTEVRLTDCGDWQEALGAGLFGGWPLSSGEERPAAGLDYDCLGQEHRLQLILLEELAEVCGAGLRAARWSGTGKVFALYFPGHPRTPAAAGETLETV